MKKHRRIIIKNPNLKNLRNNLRKILGEAQLEKYSELVNQKREIRRKLRKQDDNHSALKEKKRDIESKKQKLRRIFDKSICFCDGCSSMDKDMVYSVKAGEWFCVDCYDENLPKTFRDDWEPKYPLNKLQVMEFLQKLKKVHTQCQTNLDLSKQILTEMGISKQDQKTFLNTLYEYGGHCDCEIIMNAFPSVMADFDMDTE
jgi:hypothetical protein